MQLVIEPNGSVRCIYEEALDLHALGRLDVKRASYVEPAEDGHWTADLGPLGGPVLGPFARRSQALTAELGWLEREWIPASAITEHRLQEQLE